jgi:hypothetical protein
MINEFNPKNQQEVSQCFLSPAAKQLSPMGFSIMNNAAGQQ